MGVTTGMEVNPAVLKEKFSLKNAAAIRGFEE